jgi:hypothetical protein
LNVRQGQLNYETMLFQHYFEGESLPYEDVRVCPGGIVPLINSYTSGSLGAIHLPRMCLKGLLYAAMLWLKATGLVQVGSIDGSRAIP